VRRGEDGRRRKAAGRPEREAGPGRINMSPRRQERGDGGARDRLNVGPEMEVRLKP
jgi:hypothetical protein